METQQNLLKEKKNEKKKITEMCVKHGSTYICEYNEDINR